MLKRIMALAAVLVAVGLFSTKAHASSHIIYVDASLTSGAFDGSSWANAYVFLQDALADASVGDEIWVAGGVYYPDEASSPGVAGRGVSFELKSGVALYGGFNGTETAREQRDPAAHITVLSGDIDENDTTDANGIVTDTANITGGNVYHVVLGSGTNDTAILDGFTITAGLADGSGDDSRGGGLFNDAGSAKLANLVFSGNEASEAGGGMFNTDETSAPSLISVTFRNNHALSGGGMTNVGGSSPTLTDVIFADNSAVIGGGMANEGVIDGITFIETSPTLINVVFVGNTASDSGGGIVNLNLAIPTLINVTLFDNTAVNNGGGMFNFNISDAVIQNSIFWDNAASTGAEMGSSMSTPAVYFTLIYTGEIDGFYDDISGNILTNTDPLFVDEATRNLQLQVGSPAVDAGSSGLVPGDVTTDLAGNTRAYGSAVDMGAYEYIPYDGPIFYVDADATGANDGSSWADAFTHLQDALALAGPDDEIWVAEGIYYPDEGAGQTDNDRDSTFQLVNGVAIYGGFDGSETALSQRDPVAHITVLSGDIDGNDTTDANGIVTAPGNISGSNTRHVVTGSGTDSTALLSGVTITAGSAFGSTLQENAGGGLFNDAGSPSISDVTFSANRAANRGGGVYNANASSPTLVNTIFTGNDSGNWGGGMYNWGSSPTLTNVVFYHNSANNGGALHNFQSTGFTLTNVTFRGNGATNVGGSIDSLDSSFAIHNSIFRLGVATNTGQELYNNDSILTVTHTLIGAAQVTNVNGGSWTESGAGNITDGTDPEFVNELAGDLRLQPSSPAIDAGDNSLLPADITDLDGDGDTAETLPYDLDGNARLQDGTVDMGAYETATAPNGDPSGLTATYNAGPHQVELAWTDNANNETGFIVERQKEGASGWVRLTTTGANATSFTDETATCDQRYVYRVTATNGAGDSAPATSGVVDTACDIFDDLGALPAPFMEPWVEDFFQAGITTGKADCTASPDPGPGQTFYCGSDPVTRADMAVFIIRALEYPALPHTPTGEEPNPFSDVPADLPAPFMEDWVEEFLRLGVTTGKAQCDSTGKSGPDLYCPADNVTRADMAVFILRALGVTEVDVSPDPFADVPANLPAPFMEPFVETFLTQGITTGKAVCDDGTTPGPDETLYCPRDEVTRADMAVFILRAFDDIPDPDDP